MEWKYFFGILRQIAMDSEFITEVYYAEFSGSALSKDLYVNT